MIVSNWTVIGYNYILQSAIWTPTNKADDNQPGKCAKRWSKLLHQPHLYRTGRIVLLPRNCHKPSKATEDIPWQKMRPIRGCVFLVLPYSKQAWTFTKITTERLEHFEKIQKFMGSLETEQKLLFRKIKK